MSSAAIVAVFVACGGARDRGPNANDVSATEMPTQPATEPMRNEPNVAETSVTGSTGLPAGGGPTSWTDGPGSPGGERSSADGPPNTNHTNTITANAGGGVQPNPNP